MTGPGTRPGGGSRARGFLLALAALLAACSPGDDYIGVPAPQSGVPGTAGRECYYVSEPDAPPPFSALTRPATRGNVALWGRGMEPDDSAELSVRWAEDGKLLWVRTIRSTLPPERMEGLEDLLREAVRDSTRADWGVRVRMAGGDVVGTAPSVICPARARGLESAMPRIVDARTLVGLDRVRGQQFPVVIQVDERGTVLGVRLVRRTGSSAADQYLLDYVWRSVFWPKLHDGIALATVVEIDIEIPRRWR